MITSRSDWVAARRMKKEIIRSAPVFASLPDNIIEHLAETLLPREIPAGTLLLQEDREADRYFILVEGEVEILKAFGTPDERLLGVREAGSFIGEMSLFSEEGCHTASVRARTPLQLLEMRQADLDALLHRQPTFAYEMMRTLSRRLDESENLTIRDLRRKNRELIKAYKELEAAQAAIIEKEKLERELELAREIQLSMLPRALPQRSGFDFGTLIMPMSAVGGDFFDVFPLDDNTLAVAVGDVSDHGVPASLFMVMTVTLLRAESRRLGSPGEVLGSVNQHLLEMNETGMFVTVLYGILDCTAHELRIARAGHEVPMLLDENGKRIEVDHRPGQPLGLFSEPIFDEHCITLSPENILLMYSDGVTEAMDMAGRFFGQKRLQEVLQSGLNASAQGICDMVWDSLETFRGEAVQHDDIAMLAIRVD